MTLKEPGLSGVLKRAESFGIPCTVCLLCNPWRSDLWTSSTSCCRYQLQTGHAFDEVKRGALSTLVGGYRRIIVGLVSDWLVSTLLPVTIFIQLLELKGTRLRGSKLRDVSCILDTMPLLPWSGQLLRGDSTWSLVELIKLTSIRFACRLTDNWERIESNTFVIRSRWLLDGFDVGLIMYIVSSALKPLVKRDG